MVVGVTHHRTDGTRRTRGPRCSLVTHLSLISLGAVQAWKATMALYSGKARHAWETTRTRGTNSTWSPRGTIITIVTLKKKSERKSMNKERHTLPEYTVLVTV